MEAREGGALGGSDRGLRVVGKERVFLGAKTRQNRDLIFGIPEVALIDVQGDVMENKQLAPTYEVEPDPALIAAGRDQQLEKAVEVLMAKKPLAKQ